MELLIGAIIAIVANFAKKLTAKWGSDWAIVWAFVLTFVAYFVWDWIKGSIDLSTPFWGHVVFAGGLAIANYEIWLKRFWPNK